MNDAPTRPSAQARLLSSFLDALPSAIWRRWAPRQLHPVWLRPIITNALEAAYYVAPTVIAGGSPGQLVVGLRVVDSGSGRNGSWRQAAMRWAVYNGPGAVLFTILYAHWAPRTGAGPAARTRAQATRHDVDGALEDGDVQSAKTRRALATYAVAIVLIVAYQASVGRVLRDRLSGTTLISPRVSRPLQL